MSRVKAHLQKLEPLRIGRDSGAFYMQALREIPNK